MMKWLVALFLLVNLLLLGYFEVLPASRGDAHISLPPLQPDKIRILGEQDIAALPKKAAAAPVVVEAAPPPTPVAACYQWGSFSTRSLPRAREALGRLQVSYTLQQQSSVDATRYWVYIPRLRNAQVAQAKMDELRNLGIDDIFIVQEPQWRYAISLGVFKDEQLASRRLDDVKLRGVNSAVKAVRNQEQGQASLVITNMLPETAAEIEKLKPDFPGSELKQTSCQ